MITKFYGVNWFIVTMCFFHSKELDMKLAAIALSVAVSCFACASDIRDSWETQHKEFATPALEEALEAEGVAYNSEQFGKCLDSVASAAQKVCGGGPTPAELKCRQETYQQGVKDCKWAETNSGDQSLKVKSPFGSAEINGKR